MQSKINHIILSITSSAIFKMFEPSFPMLYTLCGIIALDFFFGLYHSYHYEHKKFDPTKFLKKLKEIGAFIVVLFATISINSFWKTYGLDAQYVANYFMSAYGFYHFFSILQNAGKMGFPIASYFQKFIESKAPDLNGIIKKEESPNENQK